MCMHAREGVFVCVRVGERRFTCRFPYVKFEIKICCYILRIQNRTWKKWNCGKFEEDWFVSSFCLEALISAFSVCYPCSSLSLFYSFSVYSTHRLYVSFIHFCLLPLSSLCDSFILMYVIFINEKLTSFFLRRLFS